MESKVISILGEEFLVNLEWYILEKKNIKKFLSEKDTKLFFKLCRGNLCNIGLLRSNKEEKELKELIKKPILAPTIAEAVENVPFAGFFKVEDNLAYFVAVNEQRLILPEGEYFGPIDEVRERYLTVLDFLEDWKEVVSDGKIEELSEILQKTKKRYYIGRRKELLTYVAGATLVMGVGGFFLYSYFLTPKKVSLQTKLNPAVIKQVQKKIKEEKEKEKKAEQKKTQTKLFSAISPADIGVCLKIADEGRKKYVGWNLAELTCSGNGVVLQLVRNKAIPVFVGLPSQQGESATVTEKIPVSSFKETGITDDFENWFVKWKSLLGVEGTLEKEKGTFTARGSSLTPLLAIKDRKDFGIIFFSIAGSNWTLKGKIGKLLEDN